jgi:hypothetical protein
MNSWLFDLPLFLLCVCFFVKCLIISALFAEISPKRTEITSYMEALLGLWTLLFARLLQKIHYIHPEPRISLNL